jgi:hypothetical protein
MEPILPRNRAAEQRTPGALNRRAQPADQTQDGLAAVSFATCKEAAAVAIILQSSVGGFSDEFMRKLPGVERAMVERGLDPSDFVISKDPASPSVPFGTGAFFFQYTVSFGEASFTVTEPTDVRFLDYFYQRCISEEEEETKPMPTLRRRPPGLVSRFLHWMAEPI